MVLSRYAKILIQNFQTVSRFWLNIKPNWIHPVVLLSLLLVRFYVPGWYALLATPCMFHTGVSEDSIYANGAKSLGGQGDLFGSHWSGYVSISWYLNTLSQISRYATSYDDNVDFFARDLLKDDDSEWLFREVGIRKRKEERGPITWPQWQLSTIFIYDRFSTNAVIP